MLKIENFKIFKRITSIFLILLLTTNAHATVSSDDGSGFVTKADFDSISKKFQDSFDSYQSGLNAKIDSAIAGYIGGLSATSKKVLSSILPKMNVSDKTFMNVSEVDTFNFNGDKWYTSAGTFGTSWHAQTYNSNPTGLTSKSGFVRLNSYSIYNGTLTRIDSTTTNAMYKIKYKKLDLNGVSYFTPDTSNIKLTKPIHEIECSNVRQSGTVADSYNYFPGTVNWSFSLTLRDPGTQTATGQAVWDSENWIYKHNLSFEDGSSLNYLNIIPANGFRNVYDQYGIDYDNRFYLGSDNLYTVNDLKGSNAGCRRCGWQVDSRIEDRKTDTFTYKFYTQKSYKHSVYDWLNYTASLHFGAPVSKIGGIPICVNKDKGKITIPLTVANSTGRCTVAIRTTPFTYNTPGTSKATEDIYYNDNVEGEVEIEIKQTEKAEKTYYIKVLPNSPGQTTSINLKGDIKIEVDAS